MPEELYALFPIKHVLKSSKKHKNFIIMQQKSVENKKVIP